MKISIFKFQSNTPSDQFDLKGLTRCQEIKVVVPNTSAGKYKINFG